MQAGELFAAGYSQAQVAHQLGVARQNVSRWHARWRQGGLEALRSAGPTGNAPRLFKAQLDAVDQVLRQGARAHGFDTDHWTLARITTVIQRLTGVAYHPGHVWRLLRHRLHYRLQRPARRAVERDEWAIARWVGRGLALESGRPPAGAGRHCVLGRVGRLAIAGDAPDWAPRGRTPVICHRFKWKRVSMAAGLCYGSRGGGAQLAFHHQLGAYDTDTLIGALGELRQFLGGQKATLLWDGLGWAARPPQQDDARLAGSAAVLAGRGTTARLRPRPQPGRAAVVQPQRPSRAWSWPTWPATPSTTWSPRPSVASTASATPSIRPSRSCGTAVCRCGEPVARREPLGRPQQARAAAPQRRRWLPPGPPRRRVPPPRD
jgi:transposase